MRIAILADPIDSQLAGIHQYTRQICQTLINESFEHDFLFIHERSNSFFDNTEHYVIRDYNWLPGYTTFRKFFLIPRLCQKLKVDAVWEPAHFGPFNLPPKIKRITTIHDLTPIIFPHWHTFWGRWLQKIFIRRILKNANLIITPSLQTAADIKTLNQQVSIAVLPLATDFTGKEEKSGKILEQYHIKKPYFLYVGTIEPRKGLDTLLKAYLKFRQNQRAQLVIVGSSGWDYEKIYQTIKRCRFAKDIIVTGYVPRQNLPAFYSHAIATIYPSNYEGFGLPALEAMACGSPLILTDNSSLPEVAQAAAIYIRPEDSNSLAIQMFALAKNPDLRQKLISAGLNRSRQFSWSSHCEKFCQLINNIANPF